MQWAPYNLKNILINTKNPDQNLWVITLKFSSPSRLTQSLADSSIVLLGEPLPQQSPPPLASGYTFNEPLVLPCSSELCPPPANDVKKEEKKTSL